MTQNNSPFQKAAAPLSPRQNAQALVSAGVSAHRTGNRDLAAQFFEQAIELDPNHADALQLMGLVAKEKGDKASAEAWMTKSLQIDAKQPHVHYNLANLLIARGATQEALTHYEQAIRQKPDYVEALIQYGEALATLDRMTEAEAPLRKAARLRPDDVSAVVALADYCEKTGLQSEAESLLREGLRKDPNNLFYRNNLGQALCNQMRYAEAVEILAPLEKMAPERAEIRVNLANALLGAARVEEAVAHYRKAIERDPLNYRAHSAINEILWELGRKDEVGQSFVTAERFLPNNPDIMEMAAETFLSLGRLAESEAQLLRAEKLRPNTIGQFRLWTALRLAQGRPDLAVQLAAGGLRIEPDSEDLLGKLTEAFLQLDLPDRALTVARRMEEIDPISQWAACYQVHALRLLGDEAAARRIYDYDRFVREVDLAIPAGYPSKEAWLASLKQSLEAMHLAKHEPLLQSLRGGTQTRHDLFGRPGLDPAIALLGETIRSAAQAFIDTLPYDLAHPFLRRKGQGLDWSGSWSVRLGGGGHHVDHIHQKGWISGVYYIDLPDCLENEQDKPGWIKFGEFSSKMIPRKLPWQKAVRPRPGMAVFFPSYMTHGTLPTTGEQTRLTVSFDIVPA
jgi:uncharacterized protein (TIGR02466 family)